jgi:YD repeat-containing protein
MNSLNLKRTKTNFINTTTKLINNIKYKSLTNFLNPPLQCIMNNLCLILRYNFLFFLFISVTAKSQSLTYDNLHRLTQIQYTNGTKVQYTYDANGNRVQHIITNVPVIVELQIPNFDTTLGFIAIGQPTNLSISVSNTGNTIANASTLKIWLSTDSSLSISDLLLDSLATPAILPGDTFTNNSWAITLPNSLVTGTYYLIVKTDANTLVAELNETNNVQVIPIYIQNCPTIALTPTITNAVCGQQDGIIQIAASGGLPGYRYSIDNGTNFFTTNTFNSLDTGTYVLQVKDTANCGAQGSYSISCLPAITLNVELLNFSAISSNCINQLSWTWSNNIQEIVLQKQQNGNSFKSLFIIPKGVTSFMDSNYSATNNCYRLKIIDNNNITNYSNKLCLHCNQMKESISVYPNPASTILNLTINTVKKGSCTIKVIGADGSTLKEFQHKSNGSSETISIDISSLSPGSYLLEFVNNNNLKYLAKFSKL